MENPFDSKGFAGFWLRVEREWAEYQKFMFEYLSSDFELEEDEEDLCDYYW